MATYYSATNGTSGGSGAIGSPWDLTTALAASLSGGDTLYLRGGTYPGRYISGLTGTSGNPITVRSYPGEWAKIDGYQTTTLASPINASETTITLSSAINLVGGGFAVSDEVMYVTTVLSPTSFVVIRGWDGTAAVSHTTSEPVWSHADTLAVTGSDTIYRDFELLDSNPTRVYTDGNPSTRRGGNGIVVSGPRTKFINLVVHDSNVGFFFSSASDGAETYGCIVYNNGQIDSVRSHGMGLYIQGLATGSKVFRKVISFNNYSTGMKAFGESGYANNITFDKIVAFNNGSPAAYPGNPAGYASTYRIAGIFMGTAVQPIVNPTITNSLLYHEADSVSEFRNLAIGYASTGGTGGVVTDNYVAGGVSGFGVSGISSATVTGNTIISSGQIGNGEVGADTNAFTWDNNTYRNLAVGVNSEYVFQLRINEVQYLNPSGGGNLKFSEAVSGYGGGWKQGSGWDANSTYTTSAPTGQFVTVLPNEYEIGRATIVAYNWDLSATVPVDLSTTGLGDGQEYEIRNVQNYSAAAVATGTYNAASPTINLTTAGLTVAMPIGSPDDFTPESTAPQFCVYELLPGEANPSAPGTPSKPTASLRQSNSTTGSFLVSWTLGAGTETSVTLRRIVNGVTTDIPLDADTTSYTDTGQTVGLSYIYAVKASNAAGDSAWSDTEQKVLTGLTCFGAPPSVS